MLIMYMINVCHIMYTKFTYFYTSKKFSAEALTQMENTCLYVSFTSILQHLIEHNFQMNVITTQ